MTAKKRLVSIIIPCYNYGRFLKDAILAALNQTYRPLEILVVDDGSTDNSLEVAKSVAKKHPEVKVFARPHLRRSATFNFGISQAKGDYIIKIDCDDKLHPKFVEDLANILNTRPDVAYVYTHAKMFGDENSIILCQPFNTDKIYISSAYFFTALFRREVFSAVSGFDTKMDTAEDWEFYLRIIERGFKGMLYPKIRYYYRRHRKKDVQSYAQSAIKGIRAYGYIIRKHSKYFTAAKAAGCLVNAILIWLLGTFSYRLHDIVRRGLYKRGIGAFYYRNRHQAYERKDPLFRQVYMQLINEKT